MTSRDGLSPQSCRGLNTHSAAAGLSGAHSALLSCKMRDTEARRLQRVLGASFILIEVLRVDAEFKRCIRIVFV
jgi:hypothetical protein